ncbi:MAG: nitroreductase family protein [Dehalococcoidia bacterium]
MDFLDVVRKRRMVRRFSDQPVPLETLERIIDAARRAPSAGYSQGVDFVLITGEAARRAFAQVMTTNADAAQQLARAPAHIVICASAEIYKSRYREPDKQYVRDRTDEEELWKVPFWYVDAGASIMLLLLAVVNEGFSASLVGVWNQDGVRTLLGIPQEHVPVGVVSVGQRAPDEAPQGSATTRPRRPLQDVLHRDRW